MARRLPDWMQPFLTWLTAKPAPDERAAPKTPTAYIVEAVLLVLCGCLLSCLAMKLGGLLNPFTWLALALGLTTTTSGLGIFQVVIFHHCSHGTVFRTRRHNRLMGRAISAVLLFKHFDHYQAEHMIHHNSNKLFTDDDEFTDFVVGLCDLAPSLDRHALWRRLTINLASPLFHGRFLIKRILGSLFSHDRNHNLLGISIWATLLIGATVTHMLGLLLVSWIIPVTVLLQIATVFRILCEHRFPSPDVIRRRGKTMVCLATAGVFPGSPPPSEGPFSLHGLSAWTVWWADMLIVQLFVRVFVLVGDAPCHDFHHRRPANKSWTDYVHARQFDVDRGCPGFPMNYIETWGLFRAIDQNFAAMARIPADFLAEATVERP
ncbi:MAG TPA: fatty acid desaturase [Bradyrhizobium sp.]|nr:fatty acid desaturase [Bradyrhizobium sp.]